MRAANVRQYIAAMKAVDPRISVGVVLSDASCGTTPAGTKICEPPADTPFAAYYGLQLLSRFIQPGDRPERAVADHSRHRPFGETGGLPGRPRPRSCAGTL
jgi:hypothetical protein